MVYALQMGTAVGYDNCCCDLHMWKLDRVSGGFAGARSTDEPKQSYIYHCLLTFAWLASLDAPRPP